MDRALAALSALALLTVLFEAPVGSSEPAAGIAVAVVFAALTVVGPVWAARRSWGGAAYVAVQLPLGYLVFGLAGAGVGATLLLLVLVAQAVRLLPLAAAAAVTLAVPLVHVGMSLGDGLRNALGTFAAAAFTAVVTELLQREQRARAELSAAHEQLRGQAAQAEELVTTRERNRFARDIHDGLGHHLTVVQMQVQAARALLAVDPERADAVLAGAQQQATDALAEVRRSVASLREPQSRPELRVALEALAAQASAAGLPARLEVVGTPRAVPLEAEEALFRAAQEGLTNVRKHAGARTARIVLDFGGAGTTRLEVSDDGRGLGTGAGAPGFGLLGLRERADRLGGRVDLSSVPGQGTALRLEVPA